MPKLKVIIIEDEFFAASDLSAIIKELGYWVSGMYDSGEEFLKATQWDFDVAVVDIFLSEKISGLDLAAKMNERQKPFIFLTANDDARTLKQAARLAPKAYITKPFKPNDVAAALEIIAHQQPELLEVRTGGGIATLNPNDIYLIKSDGAYIEIFTENSTIVQRKLLKDILAELPDSFVRVHRSFLVNANFVEQRNATSIIVKGHEVPVSRSYKPNLSILG